MHEKLGTGLRENCFGDKEVVILAFSQQQFTDGIKRTFFCPLPLQIYSSCFLLNGPVFHPWRVQILPLVIAFLLKKEKKKNKEGKGVFTLFTSQRGQET